MRFKVICLIDKNDGNNTIEYTLFIKAIDEQEAELKAKYYWLLNNPEFDYYGVKNITLV